MKKIISMGLLISSLNLFAAPLSPMASYETSNHSKSDLKQFWKVVKNIDSDMKGKDCFKRAMVWSFKLNRDYNVYSKKVFMHYTNKFNHEIDDMGRSGLGSIFSRFGNKGWDFHVAPAVTIDGVDYVLDPHLRKAPETTENWVEFLTERGEARLKTRQYDLLKDLKKARRRYLRSKTSKSATREEIADRRNKVKEIEDKLKYLGLTEDPNQKIDIKCKKITHIMEFDLNQNTEWCYYQEASMYYFATMELRFLNYGKINYDLRLPVTDKKYHTEENFQNGYNYSYERFDLDQVDSSLDEYKANSKPDSIYDI